MKLTLIISLFIFIGCARFNKVFSFNTPRDITCYSGGVVIYKGTSSGKVYSEESSDGYVFHDLESGMLMEVSGDCVMKSK